MYCMLDSLDKLDNKQLADLGEGLYMCVESVLAEELLKGEVHAVVPEVLWVRWQVDTLGMLVRQANLTIDS